MTVSVNAWVAEPAVFFAVIVSAKMPAPVGVPAIVAVPLPLL